MAEKKYPKDALVVMSILKDLGISDYEPRVVHQLIEYTSKYIATVLEDAQAISSHCKKKNIEPDDIRLAVTMQQDRHSFTYPPSRDVVMEVARSKNEIPLPHVKPHCGIRLPPDRYCTLNSNYRLKSKNSDNDDYGVSSMSSANGIGRSSNGSMKRPAVANVTTLQALRNQNQMLELRNVNQVALNMPMSKVLGIQNAPKSKIHIASTASGNGNIQMKLISADMKTEAEEIIKTEPMEVQEEHIIP